MTYKELENKARKYSLAYDTKYAEDGVLEDMLSRPQDFVDGAIMNIVQLLRKKANRDGFIAGAKEIQKENAITERIIIGEQMEIDRLEKENRELKLLSEKMENWINRIKKLTEENEQFKQQIEKMKNHNNCKWFHEWNLADIMDEPLDDLSPCQGCKNFSLWELAEK